MFFPISKKQFFNYIIFIISSYILYIILKYNFTSLLVNKILIFVVAVHFIYLSIHNHFLEMKICKLNREFEEKYLDDNLRVEFFSNVSHELRTPINLIYSVLQMKDIYIQNNDIEAIKKSNKMLKQNCLRLLRICNNLIDSTKIDGGYFSPDKQNTNIVNLVENIVISVSNYLSNENMTITFDTDSEEIYSICDSDLIERIMLNLISNSIKYASDGSSVFVNMYDECDLVKIVYMDDGPGIPKEKCADIFKRFTQVNDHKSDYSIGSGVGLSLVKSLVDLHDGIIEIESDTGLGCKFTILLPTVNNGTDISTKLDSLYNDDDSMIDKMKVEFSDIYF